MNWKQKLTDSGFKEGDFGQTFNGNVKKFNKYSDSIVALTAQHKSETDEKKQRKIAKNIEVLTEEVAALDKKLCSNIQRMINDPELVKANKARMAEMRNKSGKGSAATKPAATTAAPADEKPAATTTTPPAATQTAAAGKKIQTPPSPTPPGAKKVEVKKEGGETKKKSNVGWYVFAGIATLATLGGAWWLFFRKKK